MTDNARTRFGLALGGAPVSPLVAGLTFAAPEVLAAASTDVTDVAADLLSTARLLALDFVFVPASAPWARTVCENRGDLAVLWVVDGPLWRVLSSAGSVAEALRLTLRDPASLVAPLDQATARATAEVERGLGLGAEAVVVADDLAGSDGLLVTPEFALAYVVPRLARLARACGTTPALLHSDGNVRSLVDPLRSAGFAGIHAGGVSREDFEGLFWAARRCHISLMGGIPASSLGRGARGAAQAGTRIALLAQAGGLLVADDGGISTREEMEAYGVAVAAARGGVPLPAGKG